METRKELKEFKNELNNKIDKTNEFLEEYIQRHEVEHKKIDYEIANIKWKNKMANIN